MALNMTSQIMSDNSKIANHKTMERSKREMLISLVFWIVTRLAFPIHRMKKLSSSPLPQYVTTTSFSVFFVVEILA
jgi:hypothetical protein